MGGSAHEWIGVLPSDLEPGGSLLVDLTMTKFQAPDVTIAYEIRVSGGLFADGFESGDTTAWSSSTDLPASSFRSMACGGHDGSRSVDDLRVESALALKPASEGG